MILSEQVRLIAVQLGKSENMRIAAGQVFANAWEYVTTPGTDGAKQLSDAGRPITQKALWGMVRTHPDYPAKLGTSWRTGQRVLAIARAADPEEADKKERAAAAAAFAKHVEHKSPKEDDGPLHNPPCQGVECNSLPAVAATPIAPVRHEEAIALLMACLENDELHRLAEMLIEEGPLDGREIIQAMEAAAWTSP